MRAGGSPSTLEAAYVLRESIPAGRWDLIGDGLLLGNGVSKMRVRFEVRVRKASVSDDSSDQILFTVENVFMRDPANPLYAVPFQTQVDGLAGNADSGDKLILRFTGLAADSDIGAMYIPNSDGTLRGGRIPRIQLPQVP
ncbi:MAG: hypothetical protein JNM40_19620 [Myxococcales bacterium]|nr:hypothetical protein [Myxococcales bacterium]